MPALIITAVVNATDTLEIVGHGLVTGDGPGTPRNIEGTLPAGLVALTDYWIIRVDDDHVKLASSSANALLGTAVNLTTDGTGTTLLEIGIPYRRDVTHVVGSQVRSATLNSLEDSLKAMHALLTGQAQAVWARSEPIAFGPDSWHLASGTAAIVAGEWTFTTTAILKCPLALPVGSVVTRMTFAYDRAADGEIEIRLCRRNLATGAVTVTDIILTVIAGTGWATSEVADFPAGSLTVLTGYAYWLEFENGPNDGDVGGHKFGGVYLN